MLLTNQKINVREADDEAFIDMLNKVISTLVFQFGVNEINYIHVKNWFDHKWLNYSGKAVVVYDAFPNTEAALEAKWQEQITVPPFNPNRILAEDFVIRNGVKTNMTEKFLHKKQTSNNNLHNRISQYTRNGLMVWYSSNTIQNKRGSIMVYRVQENEIETFYASFENTGSWKLTLTKGINMNEMNLYLADR